MDSKKAEGFEKHYAMEKELSERRIRMDFTEKIITGLEKKVEKLKDSRDELLEKIDTL